MADRTSKKQVKHIDILNNPFYAKLLILIDSGYNSYSKLLEKRRKEEKIKCPEANSNIQFRRLLDNGYLLEDGIKRKYNRKTFTVNWSKILLEFKVYTHLKIKKALTEDIFQLGKTVELEKNKTITLYSDFNKDVVSYVINGEWGILPKKFDEFLMKAIKKTFNVDYEFLDKANFQYYFDRALNIISYDFINLLSLKNFNKYFTDDYKPKEENPIPEEVVKGLIYFGHVCMYMINPHSVSVIEDYLIPNIRTEKGGDSKKKMR